MDFQNLIGFNDVQQGISGMVCSVPYTWRVITEYHKLTLAKLLKYSREH